MSARQCFVYCYECKQLDYGHPDKNGVYQRDSAAGTHWDHDVHVFEDPCTYQEPIRDVLICLEREIKVSNWQMFLFRLAIDLGELDDFRRIPHEEGLAAVKRQAAAARTRKILEVSK